MNWIMNKKIYKPLDFLCSILLNVLNVTILAVVFDLLYRLYKISRTDWYQGAVMTYSETDVFYEEKSDMLFMTMAVVALVVLGYSIYTMCMFWAQQRKRLDAQLGVFIAEGFTKRKLWCVLCVDVLLDELLACAIGIGCFMLYINLGSKSEMWLSLFRLSGGSQNMYFVVAASALVYVISALVFHERWMQRVDKHGVASLIKG